MAVQLTPNDYILGLDIGDARIGVAVVGAVARLPRPLETLKNDETLLERLKAIIKEEAVSLLVVGVPRNLEGLETAQSHKIREIGRNIAKELNLEVIFVDESLSSKRADEYLAAHPKEKIGQDSIAACFILEEFFDTMEGR